MIFPHCGWSMLVCVGYEKQKTGGTSGPPDLKEKKEK
jgi:hypothetical protein